MDQKYPHLCSPIKLGNMTFRNRMFSAPMGGTDITADCCIGPKSTAFYELRAKGGAAAVTISEVVVHPETDGSHMFHLDLSTPGCLAAAAYTADAIRRHGVDIGFNLGVRCHGYEYIFLERIGKCLAHWCFSTVHRKGHRICGPRNFIRACRFLAGSQNRSRCKHECQCTREFEDAFHSCIDFFVLSVTVLSDRRFPRRRICSMPDRCSP